MNSHTLVHQGAHYPDELPRWHLGVIARRIRGEWGVLFHGAVSIIQKWWRREINTNQKERALPNKASFSFHENKNQGLKA